MEKIIYSWNDDKNNLLKETRNISFLDIVSAIENELLLEIIDNPSSNHINQKCFVLEINSYAYLVPFVQNNNEIFLKTIIPSRKYTKIFSIK